MQNEEFIKMYELERTHWWFAAKRRVSRTILGRTPRKPSSEDQARPGKPLILDVGCGTGGNLEWLCTRGQSFGIDLSESALRLCRQRVGVSRSEKTAPESARLICGEILRLPFADSTFDLVTAFDVLYHKWVADDAAAMREVIRVCRPGGYILITDSALPFLRGPHDEAYGGARRYTRATLRGVVEQAGCRVRRLSYFHFLLFPLIAAVRLKERLRSVPQKAESDLKPVHPLLNSLLKAVYAVECPLLRLFPLPVGSSIICLAQKTT
ncbi:MAG: class I SAM-dependent methyltransferase [Phycisphaerales bacterium]|nr:MAG: class I SAM-dependent methyltransferase [Phycisphaerales bacterium]